MALTSLSTGKQYKNVYTILEKVKKGEIQSHYKNDEGGLFGKLNFYKKGDLIKPHMHYIDENKLSTIVRAHVNDVQNITTDYNKFHRSASFEKIADDRKPDLRAFSEKLSETYNKFPTHLKNDIFKMFYHKMDRLEFEERTEKNYGQYKFLERANNPVSKIMTETSNLKSSIFARNLMRYFAMQLTMMEYVDPDAAQQLMNGLNGSSEFDNEDLDKLMKDMLDNKLSKNMLDDAIKDATDTCKSMDQSMPKDVQESMFENVKDGDNGASKLGPEYLKAVTEDIRRINLSLGSLKEKIKKLMDRSTSYFSAKKETIYEDLFNSDNLAGLDDYVFLHPQLRKVMVEDIIIKDTKSIGKIDIYIDISGSMSGNCGVKDKEGNSIDKLDFCKAFALKLQEMDLLNKIYIFNDRVRSLKTDIFTIAALGTSGGTCINNVVEHIIQHSSNALVLTDAEDRCRIYSEKAFFIGINGARFDYFNEKIMEQYSETGQAVIFDGSKIYKVDKKGEVIG
mgnify:CR=1 FL=1|jgi:hypothetical protein